jgi:murein DD-endopeptidase MepM/ murein hydrolase activator NlpD
MAYVKTQKFLPSGNTTRSRSALVPTSSPKVNPSRLLPAAGEQSEAASKVEEIVTVYTKKINLKKKTSQTEEKQKENVERKKVEDKLETKLVEKSESDFGLKIPGQGLVDKILKFVGFTALGFIVDKFAKYLPTFNSLGDTLQPIIDGVGGFIKVIGGAAITFVERGYAAVKSVEDVIGNIGGEGAQKTFNDVLSNLTLVLNGAIIAATIGLSTRPGRGFDGRGRGGGTGTRTRFNNRGIGTSRSASGFNQRVTRGGALLTRTGNALFGARVDFRGAAASAENIARSEKDIIRRYTERFGRRAAEQRFGRDAVRSLGGRFGRSGLTNLARAGAANVLGRSGLRAAAKVIKPLVSRLPIIGGLLEFAISWAVGDPVGKAAFRGVGSVLLGGLGTVIGGPIGAIIGGLAGGELGGLLYDAFFTGKPIKDNQTPAAQSGYNVTRGGKSQGAVTRQIQRQEVRREKPLPRTKVISQMTVPNRNITVNFDEKTIEKLKESSKAAKSVDVMSGVFSSLFGSIIDMTLGQGYKSSLPDEVATSFTAELENSTGMTLGKRVVAFLTDKIDLSLSNTQRKIFTGISTTGASTGEGVVPLVNLPGSPASGAYTPRSGPASGVQLDPGQPGVDFTPAGGNNKAVFPGEVVQISHQYNPNTIGGDGRRGAGYGNFVVIRSEDPKKPGSFFDGLYAHFPDGEIKVKVGDKVTAGQNLGRMATAAEFANPVTRKRVGSGTGAHTSLDFLMPNTNTPYSGYRENLVPFVDPTFGNQSFLPKNMRPDTSLQQNTSYSTASGMRIHEKNTVILQKEFIVG